VGGQKPALLPLRERRPVDPRVQLVEPPQPAALACPKSESESESESESVSIDTNQIIRSTDISIESIVRSHRSTESIESIYLPIESIVRSNQIHRLNQPNRIDRIYQSIQLSTKSN
jgi:hypothetical protein